MISNSEQLTAAVLEAMGKTPDPRLRELMLTLTKHLHAFVREVQLTEDEFRAATTHIARLGQLSNDSHNEVVLMAGSLGISSLVCLLNNGQNGQTTQNLLGPFWRMHSPPTQNGGSIVRCPTAGTPMFMRGRLLDQKGEPVADALIDVWHTAPTGFYEQQAQARAQGQIDMNLRGQFTSDADGEFYFWSVRPAGYPIPTDGVVGQLLQHQGRHAMRPAHIHVLAHKQGYKTLISQIYADDDPHLHTDVQFGATTTLSTSFLLQSQHTAPLGAPDDLSDWYKVEFDFQMQAGESRLPKPPIK